MPEHSMRVLGVVCGSASGDDADVGYQRVVGVPSQH